MDYASEIELPTRQINNVVLAAIPTQNYQSTLSSVTPFEQQREQSVSHLTMDYDNRTQQMVQTKDQTNLVNENRRQLHNVENTNSALKRKIEEETKQLGKAKEELQLQMSKQKIVFDLLLVFGATITMYLFFRSFAYVHVIALGILAIGILYVLGYNAYRIRLFGLDISAKVLPGGAKDSDHPKSGDAWWKTGVSSLVSDTTPSFDYSKWMSMT